MFRGKREAISSSLQNIQYPKGQGIESPPKSLRLFLSGGHPQKVGPSATEIANKAAGEAEAAAAFQSEAALKAAQDASKKVAVKASLAAQRAQNAAAKNYEEAAHLTQAAQIAQALVFKEASQAAQAGKTVQAAEAIQMLATSQLATLRQALATAEAQVAVVLQVLEAAAEAYLEQTAMFKKAQSVANQLLHQQMIAINELASSQTAAQKAKSEATKTLFKVHGLIKEGPTYSKPKSYD
ncbi:UNVERIFIED_CONTAM: hypothetical protein RMT77_002590 [Armadillidium vulgare]